MPETRSESGMLQVGEVQIYLETGIREMKVELGYAAALQVNIAHDGGHQINILEAAGEEIPGS